ncbi:MAG: energy-coupling factor transporter transmembrane protein EcfT, partial [Clostridiales bacterium]|nr:energy-coupling factor transporter transmembrane protein EcfT [Clostridiales bacterium]
MIRDITLGQYYPADSVLHKMDPRVKLAGTVLFIIGIFMAKNAFSYIFITLFLGAVIIVSKVPFKYMVKGLKAILFILIFTAVLNLFLTPGTEIWRFKFIKITEE